MIGVQQAVAAARGFATGLMDAEALAGITLEEVELSADERFWLVTFGFPAATGRGTQLAAGSAREYKTFTVAANTGNVISTNIRTGSTT